MYRAMMPDVTSPLPTSGSQDDVTPTPSPAIQSPESAATKSPLPQIAQSQSRELHISESDIGGTRSGISPGGSRPVSMEIGPDMITSATGSRPASMISVASEKSVASERSMTSGGTQSDEESDGVEEFKNTLSESIG